MLQKIVGGPKVYKLSSLKAKKCFFWPKIKTRDWPKQYKLITFANFAANSTKSGSVWLIFWEDFLEKCYCSIFWVCAFVR